ncbi:unnamed protein product [Moneuplotes crassus]|uniref:PHR domain-containing protein n=1 Tax=Euplotes crassus TaxID=5936 RepID=A0AAD1XHF6_EUPCR|nr:unnamed protein product [Moneuplotes crassus]
MDSFDSVGQYHQDTESKWRDTLEEQSLPFVNYHSSLLEFTKQQMDKDKDREFKNTDNTICKSFADVTSPVFNVGKLVYNMSLKKWYKVIDLKVDESNRPIWASLVTRNSSEIIEISDDEDFDQFTNNLDIYVNIYSDTGKSSLVEASLKIYEKIGVGLDQAFEAVGLSASSYKFFFNKREVLKDESLSGIPDIHCGDCIIACQGVGKVYKFSRFKNDVKNSSWSNCGRYADAVVFIPTQNIKLYGFSTYASKDQPQYEMKYEITIDGTEVEKETVTASEWEEEIFYRHKLNDSYQVSCGQKIQITVWIAKNLASFDYVTTYSGNHGSDYASIENEHMGMFKIENGSCSNNGTSVTSGHFPEIFYYLE